MKLYRLYRAPVGRHEELSKSIDWVTVGIFASMVLLGWINVFAAIYDHETHKSIFDFSINSGKQLIWIGTSIVLITFILLTDYRLYDTLAYAIYGLVIFLLIAVLIFGKEVANSKSWFEIGSIRIQPAEFAKFATSLALARYLSTPIIKFSDRKTQFTIAGIIALPVLLILKQNDTGSAMVFTSFIIVLYLEGMTPILILLGLGAGVLLVLALLFPFSVLIWILGFFLIISILLSRRRNYKTIGIRILIYAIALGTSFGVDYFVNNMLQKHQQNRIKAFINPNADPTGFGWNVTQSKIAIGSGGFIGKGFLQGTQTKFDFVPEQSTDFIFCTIGEEHGWLGALLVIGLFIALFFRLIFLADRQKTRFARVYGYCVCCILFFHFVVNIGMTIGLFPVVGIPLPFFSYGGSSLWSFTILLFIFLNQDANRRQVL